MNDCLKYAVLKIKPGHRVINTADDYKERQVPICFILLIKGIRSGDSPSKSRAT